MVKTITIIERSDVDAFAHRWQQLYEFGVLKVRPGNKWYKIVSKVGLSTIAQAFIDQEGNIYKPMSWSAPSKGIKGNILSEYGGLEAVRADGFIN